MSAPHTSLRHVSALDGLRGVALLGVLFFHANGALPGGYLGVDLFFVLSGYLITSLLLSEHRVKGGVDLRSFWIRRAKRLFPALLSLMPAVAIYARFFAKPGELRGLRGDALATLAYVANWRSIFSHKSYWELFAAPSPLEHTWSLSIEEQFYVVWPLVVWALLRRFDRRSVLVVALGFTALSMTAMFLLFDRGATSRVYLGTDTRAAGILAGAAMAALLSPDTAFARRTAIALDAAGVLAAIGLGLAWWKLDGQNPFLYRGGLWLTELAALTLIACAVAAEKGIVARVLSLRPLTLLGTISYGVYLWHWPVNVVLSEERVHRHGFWLHALQFGVTFAIAVVSYLVLERPIRTGAVFRGRRVYAISGVVALTLMLVVGATHTRSALAANPDHPETPTLASVRRGDVAEVRAPFSIMVLGDSTANSLGWTLRGVHRPEVSVELRGRDGCTMLADTCFGAQWAQNQKEVHPDATLVFLGGAFLHGLTLDGGWRKSCYPGWDSVFQSTLTHRLADLDPASGHVWAVTLPYPLGAYESDDYRAEVDCINASVRKAAEAVPGVRILDLGERVCPKGVCEREFDGVLIRPDGVHYSLDGATLIARWVLGMLESDGVVASMEGKSKVE